MRLFKRLMLVLLASVLLATSFLAWFAMMPVRLSSSPLEFTVRPGPMKSVSRQIVAAGVDVPAWLFTSLARVMLLTGSVKAGSYQVEQGVTPIALLQKLTRGDQTQGDVAFIEGWTFRQMRAALDANPDVRHDTIGLSDAEILARIGATESAPEGLFFPDTYLFAKQTSDLDVLARAYRSMRRVLSDQWAQRSPNLPLRSEYEALILASIVEKETGRASDRSLVASVFANRLRRGMLLQTDPTVIYGLGAAFDGNLRKRHLQTDTPYNTYTRVGLPPTPIAMPGLASLRAAVNPPASEYLYFVARGDGSSEFSRSLDEHNRAVARFILKR